MTVAKPAPPSATEEIGGEESGLTMSLPHPAPVLDERLKAALYLAQWHLDRGERHEAFRLFAQAAQSAHPAALNMLGRAYERGWGTPRDLERAIACFEAASAGGEGWAFYNLADLHLTGQGVPCDPARAHDAYVEAARRGIGKAFNMLGLLHEEGFGSVPANTDHARAYYEAGMTCGDRAAGLNLQRLESAQAGLSPKGD